MDTPNEQPVVQASARRPDEQNRIAETIAGLERDWAEAIATRNRQAYEAILAADYSHVTIVQGPTFDIQSRSQWLTAVESGKTLPWAVEDVCVTVHEGTAIATVLATSSGDDAVKKETSEHFFTDVWVLNGQQWSVRERYLGRPLDRR